MHTVRTLVGAVAIVLGLCSSKVSGGHAPQQRDALLTALQQRAATGVPWHLDHDEGEQLQAAVTAALTATPDDLELAGAATRASVAAVTRVAPAIYDAAPSAAIALLPPLKLPWNVAVAGTIELSLDGSAWKPGAEIPSRVESITVPLQKLFPGAGRPGFHVVRFRAVLRFQGHPGSVPASETRDLRTGTYGVTGTSPAGQRVAAFLTIPTRVIASELDPVLPGIPLDTWMRTVASTGEGPPPIWTTHWCEDRPGSGDIVPASLCARTMIGSSPEHGHGEVWLKIATVDISGDRPAWTAVSPTLEGIDLMMPPHRTTVSLRDLPSALRSLMDGWPRAALALDAGSIVLSPATPRPGELVSIRTELRNNGTADVFGLSIDVLAFDTREREPRLHRRFVRSIPAGESVVIESSATFPLGFGGVVVTVLPLTQESPFSPLMPAGWDSVNGAARLIRPDLAPPGYAALVRATVGCKADCTRVR